MSGAASLRGYLLQTIICLFDVLEINDKKWKSVVIEPKLMSEKVDIAWLYPRKKRVIQVKSSQNQISKSLVERWAHEFQTSIQADEYELVLMGPCSQAVIDLKHVGSVKIPPPKNNDVRGLLEQASHKLDLYFEAEGHHSTSASERELIVANLVLRLEEYSTMSLEISSTKIDNLIRQWRAAIYSNRKTGVDELDLIEYRTNKNYAEAAKNLEISVAKLKDILATMKDSRYRAIIEMKYGLLGRAEKLSTEKISEEIGLPIQRIKELEEEATIQFQKYIKKQKSNIFVPNKGKSNNRNAT